MNMKTVVITGVTRGLGLAMAEKFISLGHSVIGCGRSVERIENLKKRFSPSHDFAVVDVSDEEQVRRWAERVLASFSPPDLLLNNAAIINGNAPLWRVASEEFGRVIDVNVKGVTHVIRHFLPAMIERGAGVIVNFSSGWGRSTAAEVAPYCCTKWAIEGLTRALAQELAQLPSGLAAVPVNPGVIDTDMLRSCFGGQAGSYPSPKQWAETAVPFLLQLGPKDNGKPLSVR